MKLKDVRARIAQILAKDPEMDEADCFITIEFENSNGKIQIEQPVEDMAAVFPKPDKPWRTCEVQFLGPDV